MALDLLARGKVDVSPLITAVINLDDIVEKGFQELAGENRQRHIKILVTPETQAG